MFVEPDLWFKSGHSLHSYKLQTNHENCVGLQYTIPELWAIATEHELFYCWRISWLTSRSRIRLKKTANQNHCLVVFQELGGILEVSFWEMWEINVHQGLQMQKTNVQKSLEVGKTRYCLPYFNWVSTSPTLDLIPIKLWNIGGKCLQNISCAGCFTCLRGVHMNWKL